MFVALLPYSLSTNTFFSHDLFAYAEGQQTPCLAEKRKSLRLSKEENQSHLILARAMNTQKNSGDFESIPSHFQINVRT